MLPLLQPNDTVIVRETTFSQCQVNDIIVTRICNGILIHRVIYKNKNYLISRGDNNFKSDGKIYPDDIIGKILLVKRKGKLFDPERIYLSQSSIFFKEILKINRDFKRKNINYVFLKGLPLHLYYEKSHPRRIYIDCNVLVKKEDSRKAENILLVKGYKKSSSSIFNYQSKIHNKEIENSYYKTINNFIVIFDLHFELVFSMTRLGRINPLYSKKSINKITTDFIQGKQLIIINNEPFPILRTKNQIIFLALHFFHHNFHGAFRLNLLDKIISKYQRKVDWSAIAKKINEYKLENFVYPVFLLLKKYYQTPINSKFLRSIMPQKAQLKYIKQNILRVDIFSDEPRVKAGVTRFKNLFYLSPNPLWKKLLVFIQPSVLYAVFWVYRQKLFSFLSSRK